MVKNVFGGLLESCCHDPVTGYFRDGFCRTVEEDYGTHITCALLTDEFLEFSKEKGNDLMTPRPEYGFKGLKAGDKWCLCVSRWIEAYKNGVAPKINLNATQIKMLDYISLEELRKFSINK